MMSVGDLPFLLAALAGAAFVTVFAFFLVRLLTSSLRILRTVSGLAVPFLIAALAIGIETLNPDPHGWVLTALLLLAAISLPVTLLVSDFLVRRFANPNASNG